jgi:hypothetical protein
MRLESRDPTAELKSAVTDMRASQLSPLFPGIYCQTAINGGERCYLAELYRVKGTLFAENPDENDQTEQYFQKSLEIACEQGAKWWELRARTSQLRLLQDQGRPEQGYQHLMELYQWFTRGFDLPDLIEAKELLGQLR